MSFFNILPRNPEYKEMTVDSIPLRVVFKDGVKASPDIKFSKIDLAGSSSLFKNNSGVNDSFTITVILHDDDMVDNTSSSSLPDLPEKITGYDPGEYLKALTDTAKKYKYMARAKLITVLDYWIRSGEPFYINTDAVGIPADELWLVTEQKNRKQERNDGYVWWDLTFTLFREVNLGKFKTDTTVITKAIEKAKAKSSAKNTSSKTQWRNKLKKCDNKTLVFNEKKKVVTCVKYMQELLYLEGCFKKNVKKSDVVHGWYDKVTREAVKAYKKKYKKDYGLNEYGNSVDYKTWQVMCGTAKKVNVKTTTTTNKTGNKNGSKTVTASVKSKDVKFSVDFQTGKKNNKSKTKTSANKSNKNKK